MVVNVSIVVLLADRRLCWTRNNAANKSSVELFRLPTFRLHGEQEGGWPTLTKNYQSSLQIAQEGLGAFGTYCLDRSQTFFLDSYKDRNCRYQPAAAAINIKSQYHVINWCFCHCSDHWFSWSSLQGQIDQQLSSLCTAALGHTGYHNHLQCFSAFSTLQGNQASLDLLQPFLIETSTTDKERVQKLQTTVF